MYWPYLIYEHTWLGVTFTLLNFVRLEGLAMQDILAVILFSMPGSEISRELQ